MAGTSQGYLGTQYPVPTDPSYYLGQTGLSSLVPQAFNADTLTSMFAPQGFQYIPANALATNPFLQQFMQSASGATRLQHKTVPGMEDNQGAAGQGQPQGLAAIQPY